MEHRINVLATQEQFFGQKVTQLTLTNEIITLREKCRLMILKNRVLRRIFGRKRDEVTEDWRRLHDEELHALYSSPNIIRETKSRIRQTEHVARTRDRKCAYRLWLGHLKEETIWKAHA